ncbi:MFS transporter [Arthrobacter sp. CG_A4]|uniref:MFS transporter n=1 Tax=Arthrobacter sp. CG_A4 TaxID=3071706 RepID=UPI002DF91B94|nr:MFS family permease [Arthrobacter sp. CG_A4]
MIHSRVFPALSPSLASYASYASFAAFGIFWGTWGASVPGFRSQAGISDGQLGTALLFIGAGALPAMLLTGRVIDWLGVRITAAVALTLQGVSGLIIAWGATDFTSLCGGLLFVGAASGAADVAINAAAGAAEQTTARPVITRSHGVFSAFVVISSLGTGLSASLGATIVFSFVVVVAASVIVGLFLLRALPVLTPSGAPPGMREEESEARDRRGSAGAEMPVLAVLLLGTLGALAFAGENAHQSWSAVFFADELGAGPGLSSTAPAVFAAVVAITRFSAGALKPSQARGALILGAAAASLGAAILAAAPTTIVAWIGLAVAATGTAVLYPTLLGMLSRSTREEARGRATSLLATVSYAGFLLGPVYVGLWSEAAGLRGSMLAVAGLCAALLVLTPVLLRSCQRLIGSSPTGEDPQSTRNPQEDRHV